MSPRLYGVHNEIDPQHLQHPALAFLKQYWDKKRTGRTMPARADINPAEMKEHLGWILLLDVFSDFSDFRFRTIGTRVTQYILRDATGRTVKEAFAVFGDASLRAALGSLGKCARDHVPVRAYGDATGLGHEFLDFDALYLPLSEDGATVNMLLCAIIFDAPASIKAAPAKDSV